MRKNYIKEILLSLALVFFTACGSSNTGDSTVDAAINKFIAYAQSGGTGTAPTLQDYLDAGVIGVTADNIADINEVIGNLTEPEVDTKDEVQVLANELGVTVVDPRNTPPIAKAGATPTTVTEGETVSFSSRLSSDPDGTIESYKWTENGVVLARVPSFSKSDFSVDTHIVTLTVTDKQGATDTDTVTITVEAAPAPAIGKTAASITHNGTTYGFVTSSYTGKVWLDRNLGAARVCTSFNDTACYGDYYQWGRNFDGHQDSKSGTTAMQATDVNNAGTDFITNSSSPYDWASTDSDGSLRNANWSKTDGTSVCPAGFRVPTIKELRAETLDKGVTNRDTAFDNFLKLPSAGNRLRRNGSMNNVGSRGDFWSSSASGSSASDLHFDSAGVNWHSGDHRAYGQSVRCLRD